MNGRPLAMRKNPRLMSEPFSDICTRIAPVHVPRFHSLVGLLSRFEATRAERPRVNKAITSGIARLAVTATGVIALGTHNDPANCMPFRPHFRLRQRRQNLASMN